MEWRSSWVGVEMESGVESELGNKIKMIYRCDQVFLVFVHLVNFYCWMGRGDTFQYIDLLILIRLLAAD